MKLKRLILFLLILTVSFCGVNNYSNRTTLYVPAYSPAKNAGDYEVKGIDVSKYQGDIDWDKTAGQNISFAYIKATQKNNNVDPNYEHNITAALKAGIKVGSYHYFTFDCSGIEQAEFFIEHSVYNGGLLPPAVDVEPEDDDTPQSLDTDSIRQNLFDMLDILEAKYRVTPVIYANAYAFKTLLNGGFEKYPVWYANYTNNPNVPDGRQWTFWQYSTNGVIYNKNGNTTAVDLNVFYGSEEEFRNLFGHF